MAAEVKQEIALLSRCLGLYVERWALLLGSNHLFDAALHLILYF